MKKIIMITLAWAAFAAYAFAQDLKMLSSKLALETYAIEQTAYVSVGISSTLPSGNDSWLSIPVKSSPNSPPTAAGIVSTIQSMNLSMDVVNPKDALYIGAYVYTKDYDLLFNGWTQFYLQPVGKGYVLPKGYGDFALNLNSEIPIKLDATYAMVSQVNADGTTGNSNWINVRDGKVFFPKQLAGMDYILSVLTNAGAWKFWDIGGDGAVVNVDHIGVTFSPMFPDIVLVKDSNALVQVTTKNGVGQNKMIELVSTKEQVVNLGFKTSEGKAMQGFKYRKTGGDWVWQWVATASGQSQVSIQVGVGVYYLIPVWDSKDLTEPVDPWIPPYDGGGKG